MATGLRFGFLGTRAFHLCVDMQRLFTGDSPWAMPWFQQVLPNVQALVAHNPAHTVFTRFITARDIESTGGAWSRYYRKWSSMTQTALAAECIELVPELSAYVPPAAVVDKYVYSPWYDGELFSRLTQHRADTLIVTGGETDVCVLASVLGAVDLGFRVVVVTDAVCSSSDAAHDAMQVFFGQRLSLQVETAETAEVIEAWHHADI
jgi:nicotinamidase-related amidase